MAGADCLSSGWRIVWACLFAVATIAALSAAPASAEVAPFEAKGYSEDFSVPTAEAEERLETQQQAPGIVEQLQGRLGDRYAGVWFNNETGEFVVPLTAGASRAAVSGQFATLDLSADFHTVAAQSSWAELEAAQERIDGVLFGKDPMPGLVQTLLDPRANAVVIRVAGAAGEADLAELRSLAASEKVDVEIRQVEQERFHVQTMACKTTKPRACSAPLRGGVALWPEPLGEVGGCTTGFKAIGKSFGNRFMLTAGHCAAAASKWGVADQNLETHPLGSVEDYSFPGGDWAKIKANGSYWDKAVWPSQVAHYWEDQERAITAESWSYVGEYVCHSGNKTGTSCGNVSALGATVEDELSGAIIYNETEFGKVCSYGGDSGGSVFAGNTALGLYSAADMYSESPSCNATGYYVEITDATSALGVTVGPRVGSAPPASWHQDTISGGSTDEASISSQSAGSLDVFIRNLGSLLHRRWTNVTGWSNWSFVPNSTGIASGPSSVSWDSGRTDVVARMSDNTVGHWYQTSAEGTWSYDNLGGTIQGKPAISSWGPNRLDVFARGVENGLWHRWWGVGGWSVWEGMGGNIISAPDAVSWGSNRIDVVARASNNTVAHWYWASGWGADNLGGSTESAPTISSWGPNRLDVFTRGTANSLRHLWWGGAGWNGWEDHGGSLISGPDAVSWGLNRIDVIGQAPDSSIAHWWWG